MQINIKEEIQKMLLTYMVQPNSNIASVSVNDIIDRYLGELTTNLKKGFLFTDEEYATFVKLALKIKKNDFNLTVDEKFIILKNSSSKNSVGSVSVEDLSDEILWEISSDFNSIVIPYTTVMIDNKIVATKLEHFESLEAMMTKLKTCGKFYIHRVFKSSGYYENKLMEAYHADYTSATNIGSQQPTLPNQLSQRELNELKKMGFETDNLINNVELNTEDDE